MLIGVDVSCRFWYSVVCSLIFKSFSELITSVGERRSNCLLLSIAHKYMFLSGDVSSFFWCLG